MKVCKQFGLQDMIERESETIDTQLGFWFEVGGRYARACLLFLYCFSSCSSNECEMNKKPPAMPVRSNGFSEKIPPMLR